MIEIETLTLDDIDKMMPKHKLLNPDLPVKESVTEALDRYVRYHIAPGSFLMVVLQNNLVGALTHADSYNRASIYQIVRFCLDNLPSHCWGSKEIVIKYLEESHERNTEHSC